MTWYAIIDGRTGLPYGHYKVDDSTGTKIGEFGNFRFPNQVQFRRDEAITDPLIALDEQWDELEQQTKKLEELAGND